MNKEFKIVNVLSGLITIIIADNVYSALKKGQKHFSEPNRPLVPVRVIYDV